MTTTQLSSALAAIPASEEKLKRIKFFESFGIRREVYSIICTVEQRLNIKADVDMTLFNVIHEMPDDVFSVKNIIEEYKSRTAIYF